jgi:hypothetical protein
MCFWDAMAKGLIAVGIFDPRCDPYPLPWTYDSYHTFFCGTILPALEAAGDAGVSLLQQLLHGYKATSADQYHSITAGATPQGDAGDLEAFISSWYWGTPVSLYLSAGRCVCI